MSSYTEPKAVAATDESKPAAEIKDELMLADHAKTRIEFVEPPKIAEQPSDGPTIVNVNVLVDPIAAQKPAEGDLEMTDEHKVVELKPSESSEGDKQPSLDYLKPEDDSSAPK